MYFIDANIIVRILTRDDPSQSAKALALMERIADGRVTGITTEGVILEVVQVLSSKRGYAIERSVIRDSLLPILTLPDLDVDHRDIHLHALELFASTRLDYVDCLSIAYAHGLPLDGIVSFDRELDRYAPGVRIEPDHVP